MDGSWEYLLGDGGDFNRSGNYLDLACSNIALLTILDIRATIFSRGRICVLDKDGNEIEDDPILKKFKNPNFTDSQADFLYKHLFYKGLGNNITRVIHRNKSKDVDSVSAMIHLIPSQINYGDANKFNDFVFASSDKKKAIQRTIEYKQGDRNFDIPLEELILFYDIASNMTSDSAFVSPSKIDALLPDLKNIEEAQKAKNINLKFSSKFLVSGKKQGTTGEAQWQDVVLEKDERDEIENKVHYKDILVNPNGLEVHSLANDLTQLMYDEGIAAEFARVCGAYGISRDVINWFANGATTYTNKKEAIVGWIQNSIQYEGEDFGGSYSNYFGYDEEGKTITLKYDHLPIMRAYQDMVRTESYKTRIKIAKGFIDIGMERAEAFAKAGIDEIQL